MTSAVRITGAIRTPRLIRRYLLLSLLVTITITTAVSLTAHEIVSNDLMAKDKALAEQGAAFLWNQLHEHWLDPLLAATMPDTRPLAEAMGPIVARVAREVKASRVNLIDASGHVIYSSYPDWNDKSLDDDDELSVVLRGGTVCNLKDVGERFDLGGVVEEPLLETYVAVGELSVPGRPKTPLVIELYQAGDRYLQELRRSRIIMIGIAVTCLTVMFAAHLWLFVQGNQTIVARTRELERLSQHLEELVAERTRELVVSRRLADVGQMAAGVAHEINTPLASIATCAEGLLRRTQQDDSRQYLEIIRKEAYRVKTITRNLLDFSRLQMKGDVPPRIEDVEAATVVREVGDLLAFGMTERKIAWEMAIPDDVKVRADRMALHQIVLNLSSNCIDALPQGGRIRWEAAPVGDQVRLRCSDDGMGIDPDLLEHVMDPFVTTKRTGQGTGLGLSVAFALARQQDGTLSIDSPGRGRGTTATLVLPRA